MFPIHICALMSDFFMKNESILKISQMKIIGLFQNSQSHIFNHPLSMIEKEDIYAGA